MPQSNANHRLGDWVLTAFGPGTVKGISSTGDILVELYAGGPKWFKPKDLIKPQ